MRAMTMGFDVLKDTNLVGIEGGEKVEFLVKKGADGIYRVFALCGLNAQGPECLKAGLAR